MNRWVKFGLIALLLIGQASCSSMHDYKGHTVFNPFYLWYLESKSRDKWQMPEEVLDALHVSSGDVVADIGAGGGYFTEKLAKRVGSGGHVFATDVQDIMIKKLTRRVAKRGLTNVTVIRAAFDDPRLPPSSCDLVLFSSVYKEIDDRVAYMQKLRNDLKNDGRVAILEYRPNEESPGPPRQYRLTKTQVIGEMKDAGYELSASFNFLPRENFLVFQVKAGISESEADP